ncbi:hypothetical protein [Frankia sp. AgB32]|uniref:hypothetical protein n=1 Tax=Frankia sp. AgB32 TaxID=631119 RepID=UPI00200F23CE|nr:hypothetical protein [Frankia sp. AgB32]MCK9897667.1 hypothetical protein [Frankia sp. AgB32]
MADDLTPAGLRALLDANEAAAHERMVSLTVPVGLLRQMLAAVDERDRLAAHLGSERAMHEQTRGSAAGAAVELGALRQRVAELENARGRLRTRVRMLTGQRYERVESAAADTAGSTTPVVTDAMVRAAIDGVLDLRYGDHEHDCHRHHDGGDESWNNGCGGYDWQCPFCRVTGAHPSVGVPARERVFRAALTAALAVSPAGSPTPSSTTETSR